MGPASSRPPGRTRQEGAPRARPRPALAAPRAGSNALARARPRHAGHSHTEILTLTDGEPRPRRDTVLATKPPWGRAMTYVRVSVLSSDPAKQQETERFANELFVPGLRQLPGFRRYTAAGD